ncbi:MAG: leucine-rich repeat protein, partial [Mycoplasma sp.]
FEGLTKIESNSQYKISISLSDAYDDSQSVGKKTFELLLKTKFKNTSIESNVKEFDQSIYDFKQTILFSDENNAIDLKELSNYLNLTFIPEEVSATLMDNYSIDYLEESRINVTFKLKLDKWYENDSLIENEKEFEFIVNLTQSKESSITVKDDTQYQIFTKSKLLQDLEYNQTNDEISINSSTFNEIFDSISLEHNPTVKMKNIKDHFNEEVTNGFFTFDLELNKYKTNEGEILDGPFTIKDLKLNYLAILKIENNIIKGFNSGYENLITNLKIPQNVIVIDENSFINNENIETIEFTNIEKITTINSNAFKGCKNLKLGTDAAPLEFPNTITIVGNGIFSGINNSSNISVPKTWDDLPDGWINGYQGFYTVRERKSILNGELKEQTYDYSMNSDEWEKFFLTDGFVDPIILGDVINDENQLDTFPKDNKFSVNKDQITILDNKVSIELQASKWYDEKGNTKTSLESDGGRFTLTAKHYISEKFIFNSINGEITGTTDKCGSDIIIPESIFGIEVKSIGDAAFKDITGVNTISFDQNSKVEKIKAFAFSGVDANITNIPTGIKYIGEQAFFESNIKEVNLNNVEILGNKSFYASKLEKVDFDNNNTIESIPREAFAYCRVLSDIKIPESVKKINLGAFSDFKFKLLIKTGSSLDTDDTWISDAGITKEQIGKY